MSDPQDKDYSAMTVNERLFAAGLLDEFDRAVRAGNVATLEGILRRVQLSDENVAAVIKKVLPPPARE